MIGCMKRSLIAPLSLFIFLGFAGTAPAQISSRPYQLLANLQEFLQLSDTQVETILTNNNEFNRWSLTKQARVNQVQGEIAAETVKEALDPMALGVRYVELEAICRQFKTQVAVYQQKNIDSLTPPQKAKLVVLQDVIKLAPAISEAQSGNLLNPTGYYYVPQYFYSNGDGFFLTAFQPGSAIACTFSPPFPFIGPAKVESARARPAR